MDKLYDAWARRNPSWDKRFQQTVIDKFCNYRTGAGESAEQRGKKYGAGYEIFIIAFFLGLYADQERRLTDDPSQRCDFGQPIEYWGNVERKGKSAGRVNYGALRKYMFAALIAKTDLDFISLDQGKITLRKAVDALIDKMENYANYGFQLILDKEEDRSGYFYKDDAFFKLFESKGETEEECSSEDIVAPSLD